ncbi:MAG: chemotaxis protein CheY [Firmicutes bacterium]|nr:chemotaxis protein CheY [Bacillota bacterium]
MFVRKILKDLITTMGYDVVGEAVNGVDCIQKFSSLQPDITLLDIAMPEMDGIAALQEIRRQSPEAVVIMVSALGQDPIVAKSISLGARDFVIKPIDRDSLKRVLGNV